MRTSACALACRLWVAAVVRAPHVHCQPAGVALRTEGAAGLAASAWVQQHQWAFNLRC